MQLGCLLLARGDHSETSHFIFHALIEKICLELYILVL